MTGKRISLWVFERTQSCQAIGAPTFAFVGFDGDAFVRCITMVIVLKTLATLIYLMFMSCISRNMSILVTLFIY